MYLPKKNVNRECYPLRQQLFTLFNWHSLALGIRSGKLMISLTFVADVVGGGCGVLDKIRLSRPRKFVCLANILGDVSQRRENY